MVFTFDFVFFNEAIAYEVSAELTKNGFYP